MNTKSRPTRRIPFWGVLVLGSLLACIGTFSFVNLGPIYLYNHWMPLGGPPSGVAHIAAFAQSSENDGLGALWVKANNGNYYLTRLLCLYISADGPFLCPGSNLADWRYWIPVEDYPQKYEASTIRGDNCTGLVKGLFPFNPAGVRECVYTYLRGDLGNTSFYIALTEDGSLKIWQNPVDLVILVVGGLFSAAVSVIVALLIAFIHMTVSLDRRNRIRSESLTRPGSSR